MSQLRRWGPAVAIWGLAFILLGSAILPTPADVLRLLVVFGAIVVIHEAAHATVGAMLGFELFAVRLGAPVLFRRWIDGRLVELGPLPLGGHVAVATANPRGWRWRQIAVSAAGSVVNILVGFAALLAWSPEQPVLWDIFFFSVFIGVANLIPRRIRTPLGRQPNDGRRIWELLRGTAGTAEEAVGHHRMLRAIRLLESGREDRALDLLQDAPADVGEHAASLKGTTLTRLGRHEEAIEILRPLVDAASGSKEEQAIRANNLAWALLLRDEVGDAAEALNLSTSALGVLPRQPALQGTHGFAQILAGDRARGMELVLRSARKTRKPQDRALNLCCSAVGAAADGQDVLAAELLTSARALDPSCLLLGRAEAAVKQLEVS